MQIADLFAKVGFRVDKKDLSRVDKSLGRMKTVLASVATGFAASKVAGMINSVAESADNFAKMSRKVGISVEKLQQLEFAAQISGSNINTLRTGLQRFARTADDAGQGLKSAQEPFKRLGINTKDASGNLKDLDTLLLESADRIAGMEDGTAKTALAMKLFGRSGAELIPLLNEGSVGIERLRNEFAETGAQISGEDAKAFEEYNDTMLRVKTALRGFLVQGVIAILPHLKALSKSVLAWVKANKAMLKQRLGQFLKGFVKVLWALGKAMGFIVKHGDKVLAFFVSWKLVTLALAAAQSRFAAMSVVAALKVTAAWMAAALPFVLIAALAVVVALLIEDIWTAFMGGESVLKDAHEWLVNVFVDAIVFWRDQFKRFFGWLEDKFEWVADKAGGILDSINPFGNMHAETKAMRKRTAAMGDEMVQVLRDSESAATSQEALEAEMERRLQIGLAAQSPVAQATPGNSTTNSSVNATVNVNGANASPEEIATKVTDAIKDLSRRMVSESD